MSVREKQYQHETFTFEEHAPFQVFRITENQKILHCHDCLEINLIEAGSGTYFIGGKSYKIETGDLFIINNTEHHLAVSKEELNMLVIVFPADYMLRLEEGKEFLKPFFARGNEFSNRIVKDSEFYHQIMNAILQLWKEWCSKEPEWKSVSEAWGKLLLAYLYRYYVCQAKQLKEGDVEMAQDRIYEIFRYIETHFQEAVTLEELAQRQSVHKNYLCRYFKKATGMTLFSYLEQVRIQYACYLLIGKELSVTQVAMESGFSSLSFFNRVFKKYKGVSPGKYRSRG